LLALGIHPVSDAGRYYMRAQTIEQWHQRHGAGTHLVGERRGAQRCVLRCISVGLSVQRLVLDELFKNDHGQLARAGPVVQVDVELRGGGGIWQIASDSWLVNFRTSWLTFHWRGITSSVSLVSSPCLSCSGALLQDRQVLGAG